MSIRITKKLGYGFVAPETELSKLVHVDEDMMEREKKDYESWLRQQSLTTDEELLLWYELNSGSSWNAYQSLHTALLPSGDKAVLIIPPGLEKIWVHFHDPIDLAEELKALEDKTIFDRENSVTVLNEAPSPFDKLHMDSRTGLKLRSAKQEAFLSLRDLYRQGLISGESDNQYAKAFNCETLEEVFNVYRPYAPAVVTWFARWMQLFTDSETESRLQPLILKEWV